MMKTIKLTALPVLAIILGLVANFSLSGCRSATKSANDVASPQANPLVPTSFGPSYKYSELMTKDYDDMLAMVQDLVKKAHDATSQEGNRGDAEAVAQLGRAMKLIFSRPDMDNMVAKLMSEIRRDLQGFSAFEDTLAALTMEALMTVNNHDAPVGVQATALVELENILADIRPELRSNSTFRYVAQRIRDANVQVSDEVRKDRRMRGMLATKNPSEEARKILALIDGKKK